MNKNGAIFLLVVLIFISGIWGSLADRKKLVLQRQLDETVAQMDKLALQNDKQREQVLGKTAELQEELVKKEEQLDKARKELISLRKEQKSLEAKLSECNATIQKLTQEKNRIEGKTGAGKEQDDAEVTQDAGPDYQSPATGGNDVQSLREDLQAAELTIDKLRRKLDAADAQMLGLEKLLDEKNSAMEEVSQNMDRLQINMDVLLAKIADQRDELQELHEDNRNLVKELTLKNEESAGLREELMRQPVRE